jgi:hypothetical protein
VEQLQQWRQRDLLMFAEANRQARLNIAVRAEITNLLKLLIGECVVLTASATKEANNE